MHQRKNRFKTRIGIKRTNSPNGIRKRKDYKGSYNRYRHSKHRDPSNFR